MDLTVIGIGFGMGMIVMAIIWFLCAQCAKKSVPQQYVKMSEEEAFKDSQVKNPTDALKHNQELQRVEKERDLAQSMLTNVQRNLSTEEACRRNLEMEKMELSAQIQSLKKQNEAIIAERDRIAEENTFLKEDASNFKTDLDNCRGLIYADRELNKRVEDAIVVYKAKSEEAEEAIRQSRIVYAGALELRRQNEALTAENESLKAQSARLKKENDGLMIELGNTRSKVQSMEADLYKQRDEMADRLNQNLSMEQKKAFEAHPVPIVAPEGGTIKIQ